MNLSKREKLLLQILIAVCAGALLFLFVISPLITKTTSIGSELHESRANLHKLQKIYDKYREFKDKKNHINRLLDNKKSVSSYIEQFAKDTNILKNRTRTRERSGRIQGRFDKITTTIRFESVDAKSLFAFLHKMENSNKIMKVSYLRMRKTLKNSNLYDVNITFESYKK